MKYTITVKSLYTFTANYLKSLLDCRELVNIYKVYTFANFRKSLEFIRFYVLTEVNKIKGFTILLQISEKALSLLGFMF